MLCKSERPTTGQLDRPRVVDHTLAREAIEIASLAAHEPDHIQRRRLEAEALRLWQEAHGRLA